MKKRVLLLLLIAMTLLCLFAISVGAAEIDYSEKAVLADGKVLPIYDENKNPLIWYVSGTGADGEKIYASVPNNRNEPNTSHDTYVTYVSSTGQWAQLNEIYIHTYNSEIGEYISTVDDNLQIVVLNLREFDMIYLGGINTNHIQYMYYPATLKDCPDKFKGKTELRLVDMSVCNSLVGGFGGTQNFSGCSNLHTVRLPIGPSYTFEGGVNWKFKETAISTMVIPEVVTSIGTDNFFNCRKLKSIYILGNNTSLGKRNFQGCTSLESIYFLGNSPSVTANEFKENFVQCIDEGKTYNFDGIGKYFYFVSTDANYLAEIKDTIGAVAVVPYDTFKANKENYTDGRYVISGTNICEVLYNSEHDLEVVDNCLKNRDCERNCGYTFVPQFGTHKMEKTLTYVNGFDQNGLYSCVCANATYCIADDITDENLKYAKDQKADPIIVFKGYSVPEKANYKGINAGFEINKNLLALYEKVNDDTVKFNLLMVNSQIGENNITKILEGEELAENVKGINIKITSTNYCDIDVSVRGFDDSAETGNFYTLKLITALAVRTKDSVHYAQGALKNSPNTTIDVGGTAFNIVTANNVYNPVNS